MQSLRISWIALLPFLLAGLAYGSTSISAQYTRDIGEDFEAAVITLTDVVEQCYITTPSMENVVFKPNDESNNKFELLEGSDVVGCRVRVRDLQESDSGRWAIHTVSTNGIKRSNYYTITVNSPAGPDSPPEEDLPRPEEDLPRPEEDPPRPEEHPPGPEEHPPGPEEDPPRPELELIKLDELRIETILGTAHRIEIPSFDFVKTEHCYLVSPDGNRIDLESQEVSGIEVIKNNRVACGVIVSLKNEAQVGKWYLISKEIRFGLEHRERRLPFRFLVTEEVNAIPNEINVVENKDFYVRLGNVISDPETCKLLRPDGTEYTNFETDPRYINTCGFIVRNVNKMNNGTWRIVYGNRITFNAAFQVAVNANGTQGEEQNQMFVWTRDKQVQEVIGSNDTVYCKVIDPKGFVVFEGFGRCNISLPRATMEHEGTWSLFVGTRGRVLTEESKFKVQVVDGSTKAKVKTEVAANNPVVTLSCSVSSPYPIVACKFRDPSGRILIANPGVGEDRYTFHGEGSSYESGVYTHDCGIQITNPLLRDLGFWRCAIETTEEAYYGFLTAWCPWATKDPEVHGWLASSLAVMTTQNTENIFFLFPPFLTADRAYLEVIEGDSTLMSCSVPSSIRYCYFRVSNGTVYNVGPGFSSTDMGVYAGSGLDAGECSIRFRSLSRADTRTWSCHVGFHDLDMPEQRADFEVDVYAIMRVGQNHDSLNIIIEGRRQLDYCRFVRADGFGFISDAVPEHYFVKASLHIGECTLWMLEPNRLDRRPWTVMARITGHTQEITRTTNGFIPPPPPRVATHRLQTLWLVFLISGIIMIILGVMVVPKKNRTWTYTKAASFRSSFRQRFAKKAVVEANVTDKNTANAA